MTTRSALLGASGLYLFFVQAALAQNPATAPASAQTPSAGNVIVILFLCGLMGLTGQAARTIVGLKTLSAYKSSQTDGRVYLFDLARLITSLIIGFVAGLVTGLLEWKTNGGLDKIAVGEFDTMIKFAIAGYIGSDVIESFTVQFFDKRMGVEAAASDATSNNSAGPEKAEASNSDGEASVERLSAQLDDVKLAIDRVSAGAGSSIPGTDYPAWALSRDMNVAKSKYWNAIVEAADSFALPISIICAIGSKESHWGLALSPPGPGGTGDRIKRDPAKWGSELPPDGQGWGRGLMRIDWHSHEFARTGAWDDARANIMYGCKVLSQYVDKEIKKGKDPETALSCAISDYNGLSGPSTVYSRDVLARAAWISQQGYDKTTPA